MQIFQTYKKAIIIAAVLIGACFIYFLVNHTISSEMTNNENEVDAFLLEDSTTEQATETEAETNTLLVLDIKGAIQNPGVYELQVGSRVHHLIEAAGGIKDDGDELAVNLAAPLEDGMVIYIPTKGEVSENPFMQSGVDSTHQESSKVNINLASSEELQTLTGIGPSKAEAIIAYREEKGLFSKPEDIMEVSGIGEKSFEKMKDEIAIK